MNENFNVELLYRLNHKLDQFITRIDSLSEMVSPQNDDEWLSPKEAANYLKVCERSMRTYIATGAIPSTKFGGRVYIKKSDIKKTIQKS